MTLESPCFAFGEDAGGIPLDARFVAGSPPVGRRGSGSPLGISKGGWEWGVPPNGIPRGERRNPNLRIASKES